MTKRFKKQAGYTLIEVVIFLVVSGLLMSTVMLGAISALRNTPTVHQEWVAMQLARQCMEWLLDQTRINGYATYACSSAPAPTACTSGGGYTITTSVQCITWDSDNAYKTISVTISGKGNATLSAQVGNY